MIFSTFDYYKKLFTSEYINLLIDNEMAIKADNGGLVIGRSHAEGGVYFIVRSGEHYYLEGELEGYEFIFNIGATAYYEKSFHIFNNHDAHKTVFFETYTPLKNITLLDTTKDVKPKYLIFESGGFGIVNKYSTKGFIHTLNEMNNLVSYEMMDDNSAIIVNNQHRKLDIYFYDQYIGYLPA